MNAEQGHRHVDIWTPPQTLKLGLLSAEMMRTLCIALARYAVLFILKLATIIDL